jgi:hypothetical protein
MILTNMDSAGPQRWIEESLLRRFDHAVDVAVAGARDGAQSGGELAQKFRAQVPWQLAGSVEDGADLRVGPAHTKQHGSNGG